MKRKLLKIIIIGIILGFLVSCTPNLPVIESAQLDFSITLNPFEVENFNGLHSFAWGQHDGKWLLVGGRIDGLHTRMPMNSFPLAYNNRQLIVIDPLTQQSWSSTMHDLPLEISEHLQSTNTNFYQKDDTLYIVGGYAFSETANRHITFPQITTLKVSQVIQSIIQDNLDPSAFQFLVNQRLAVTGGQLGFINESFYLVGGHRFDGRYNPMNMHQFSQTYTHAIQQFEIQEIQGNLTIDFGPSIVDEDHLRRRDFNLVPYIFQDQQPGYLISAGVFQKNADLPFLYPVEINESSYQPIESFNQYLSHYHSAKLSVYSKQKDELVMVFFGGLAQYYPQENRLIKDDKVPFVKTISAIIRDSSGQFKEQVFEIEMPYFQGTSGEFIPNTNLVRNQTGVFMLDDIHENRFLIGYIVGGIISPYRNPFSSNQTNLTEADKTIFEIWIEKNN